MLWHACVLLSNGWPDIYSTVHVQVPELLPMYLVTLPLGCDLPLGGSHKEGKDGHFVFKYFDKFPFSPVRDWLDAYQNLLGREYRVMGNFVQEMVHMTKIWFNLPNSKTLVILCNFRVYGNVGYLVRMKDDKIENSFCFQHAKTICKAKCVQRDFVLFYHTSIILHYLNLKGCIGDEMKKRWRSFQKLSSH